MRQSERKLSESRYGAQLGSHSFDYDPCARQPSAQPCFCYSLAIDNDIGTAKRAILQFNVDAKFLAESRCHTGGLDPRKSISAAGDDYIALHVFILCKGDQRVARAPVSVHLDNINGA